MTTLRRYFAGQLVLHIGLVLAGFVLLFAFVDSVSEIRNLGRGGYTLEQALTVVVFRIPGMVYELLPVATLIGAVWALAQLAAGSEFTVARASGLGPRQVLGLSAFVGLPLVAFTFFLAEVVLPVSEVAAVRTKASADGRLGSGFLSSGFWMRDYPTGSGEDRVRVRMVNLNSMDPDRRLQGVRLYEFGELLTLRRLVEAESAVFLRAIAPSANAQEASIWRLEGVRLTDFAADGQVTRSRLSSLELSLYLSPARLGALMVKPEQMSARELFLYVDYLQAGKQASGRYEIAFWKKMIYPVAVWVMLVLALPAAYIQARGGALGLKVFLAIVAGIGFHLANSLFSHLGLLNDWPAPIVAAIPSLLALAAGLLMLWQLQRRAF